MNLNYIILFPSHFFIFNHDGRCLYCWKTAPDCGPFKLGEADENAKGTGSNDDYSSDEGLKIKK